MPTNNPEQQRLDDYHAKRANWKHWGPYLSDRAWGTVREDYSANGSAWTFFPHEHARSRAYRWNEDGLLGISDRNQYLCFGLALWNRRDPILKERLFGVTGAQANHGEDVKEYYFYLDSTPTHSYMKALYKYPQGRFPYEDLIAENSRRGYFDYEYELIDTGIFEGNRYFDVFVEYAKAGENDVLIRIEVVNRGADAAECDVLPTLWFRNTWGWGYPNGPMEDVARKPLMAKTVATGDMTTIFTKHSALGEMWCYAEGAPELIFTENDTNTERLFDAPNPTPYVKDAFHRYLIEGEAGAVNPANTGTKAAAVYRLNVPPGSTQTLRLRMTRQTNPRPFADFDGVFAARQREADQFYADLQKPDLTDDERMIQRQAFAGMLWSKQLFYYDVEQWLNGDPAFPPPPESRRNGRNHPWEHLNNFDIISMPDKWEYPWYAGWDLAFHCITLVMVDGDFAKRQIELLTREWYMHPNGQIPAYEWNFGDVNPPVHAWAAWRVYKIDGAHTGKPDRAFLEGTFHKLLMNFTWWVNQKDAEGRNVFQGGFLGLDNISIFDRSAKLPTGGHIDQSDGTAWMGFYSLVMLKIALELARENPIYQDLATKFFEHFLAIARTCSGTDGGAHSLWDDEDGFFYDWLRMPDGSARPLKVRSLVGLMSLLAVETLDPELLDAMPDFKRRTLWFLQNRPHLSGNMASMDVPGLGERRLISIVTRERLTDVMRFMLDEDEFLSDYGIRSVSKFHEKHPYSLTEDGATFTLNYQPAESQSGLFGGNSNWRGPIWFPINFLLIESLQKFHHYYGDDFKVELPTGSGNWVTLGDVATELSRRLCNLFERKDGRRAIYGGIETFQNDPHWRDLILFNEYFHGDNGAGLGASHQTGWTGLVAKLIQQSGGTE
jgi:hypothetical protein